jgi:hypothetical protein
MFNATFATGGYNTDDFRLLLLRTIPQSFLDHNTPPVDQLVVIPLEFFKRFASEYGERLDGLVKSGAREGLVRGKLRKPSMADLPVVVVRYAELMNALMDAAPVGTINLTALRPYSLEMRELCGDHAEGERIILSVGPDFMFKLTNEPVRGPYNFITTLKIGHLTLLVAESPEQIVEAINASRRKGYSHGLWPVPPAPRYYGSVPQ